MQPPPTPFEVGFSDGEFGQYRVPRQYSWEEAEEYRRGYNKGYDYYRQKLMSQYSKSDDYGPYLDKSWIPKNGGYS